MQNDRLKIKNRIESLLLFPNFDFYPGFIGTSDPWIASILSFKFDDRREERGQN